MPRLERLPRRGVRRACLVSLSILGAISLTACGSSVPSRAVITGRWSGELSDRTTGVLFTMSLVDHGGGAVTGQLETTLGDRVHIEGRTRGATMTLDFPGGEDLIGDVTHTSWAGSLAYDGHHWHFQFTKD